MSSTGSLVLDAEALYRELVRGVRSLMGPETRLVGITSGGAWLVERLQKDLGLPGQPGVISSALHRDDFAQRGLSSAGQTLLPFDVNGADVLLLDDVLYTGRTLRAVINELFDRSTLSNKALSERSLGLLMMRPSAPRSLCSHR